MNDSQIYAGFPTETQVRLGTFLRHQTEAFLCDRTRRRRTGDECTGFPYDFAERLEQCQRDSWQVAGHSFFCHSGSNVFEMQKVSHT